MTELVIRAIGRPAPQGSKSYKGHRNGKPVLAESSKRVKPWRQAVHEAAESAITATGWATLDAPARLIVEFYLAPPKTMPKGRVAPTTYPDLSKLVRSTEDALVTAGVLRDDALIVRTVCGKFYAQPGQPTGARIIVQSLDEVIL